MASRDSVSIPLGLVPSPAAGQVRSAAPDVRVGFASGEYDIIANITCGMAAAVRRWPTALRRSVSFYASVES